MESLGRGTATCGKEGKKEDFPSVCTRKDYTTTSDTNCVGRSGQFAILYQYGESLLYLNLFFRFPFFRSLYCRVCFL